MRQVRAIVLGAIFLAYAVGFARNANAQGWTASAVFGEGQLSAPTSVAFAANGDYWISDCGDNTISRFNPAGIRVLQIGGTGSGPGKFGHPWGIATDLQGNLYVTDTFYDVVQKFDANGAYVRSFSAPGRFSRPRGIAVDWAGNFYVSCETPNRIEKFDSEGNFLFSFGSAGSGNGQFNAPTGVAIAHDGGIVVADYHNRRIQRFTASGSFVWATPTKNNEVPEGVAVAWDGRILVATHSLAYPDFLTQTGTSNVQVFGHTGSWKETLGSQGAAVGQLDIPLLCAIAPNGDLLIAEAEGQRVSLFKRSQGKLVLWGDLGDGRSNIPAGLNDVVQFDMAGHILALRANGTVVAWGSNAAGQANVPAGLNNVVQVQAGDGWSAALKSDGTVVGWGQFYGPDNPYFAPQPESQGLIRRLGDGYADAFGIRADGKTVWWGIHSTGTGKSTILSGDTFVEVGAGLWHGLGLRANGTVGILHLNPSLSNAFGQLSSVTSYQNVVEVNGGHSTSVFLYKNGTVSAQGYSGDNRLSGFGSLQNVVRLAISPHSNHMLGVNSQGSLVGFGGNAYGQLNFPVLTDPVLQLACNGSGSGALVAVDSTPPNSTISLSPSTPASTWFNTTPVTATVAATDNSGGSGVKEIRYSVNMGAEQVVAGASATINLSTEGVHTIAYWAVDIAGNTETTQFATVKIDKTAPAVAASLSNNTLTLTSTDSLSGVQWTKFRFDNGAEQVHTGPVTVPSTARTVSFRASDIAGNVSAVQTIANGTLLKGISLTPSGPAYAGSSVVVKVELFASAPAGGLVVALASSQPSVLPLPATLTVPAGASSVSTTVVLGPVPTDTGVQVEATLAGEWARTGMTVLVPTPKSVTLAPSLVSGGMTSVATVTLVSKAPAGGQVVSLESLDPSVASVPTSVTIPAGATSAKFTVTTFPVSSDRSVLIQAQADNTAAVAVLAVRRVVVSTLTLGAKSVTGGVSTTGTVALNRPAPSGGLTVVLSSTETAVGAAASVVVPAGATSATFPITTSVVSRDIVAGIRAAANGTSARASLTVLAARIAGVGISPASVTGGTGTTMVVTLTGPAPSGGLTVGLARSNTAASLPSSVVIPAGSASASVPVNTSPVSVSTAVVLSATLNRDRRDATLTVKP